VTLLTDNGVDLDVWSPSQVARETPPTFVFAGRLIRLKGVDLLIEAFARLQTSARLLIVGDGEERLRLEALAAARTSVARPIEFAGFRPQTELRDILARASALVLPSLRECGGAVILEAFACRTPAIATAWGGPKDYVTPESGFLVAPDSREDFIRGLTAAMHRLAVDPALVEKMGEAARALVEARFSWSAKARAILAIYEEVVRECAPTASAAA
jgi:glycosyltransferase involved in cell wall biosynthesis